MRKEFDDYVAGLDGVKTEYHTSLHTFKRADGTAFCTSEVSPRSSIFLVSFPGLALTKNTELPSCAEADKTGRVNIRVVSRGRLEICKQLAKQRLA